MVFAKLNTVQVMSKFKKYRSYNYISLIINNMRHVIKY